MFRALDQGETVDSVKNLLVAPHCLQNRLLNQIDGEIEAAARGEGGYIGIKINSLTDKVLINKLIEASQAGVHIDMVVRGICCLRAGVPDETENIHIISIVGRYLEHSRIYIFGRGARARYYIGSADWMTRSTLRRVEIAAPVTAPALKARLQHIFDTMLADNCNARVQQPDGSYVRRMPGADAVDCQAQFYEEAYQANVHSSLKGDAPGFHRRTTPLPKPFWNGGPHAVPGSFSGSGGMRILPQETPAPCKTGKAGVSFLVRLGFPAFLLLA